MTITIKSISGITLAEVDSDTIFSDRIKATYHSCPECGHAPGVGRDDGCWYLFGTTGCSSCHGLYAMPSEQELADMIKKAGRS